jgi:SAM-dependent methyltransferase
MSNPEEWEYYHAIYREEREAWPIVPYKKAIEWLKARPHWSVGDFGCGEAFLASELDNPVFSFDHVAINNDVVACDMSHVPLDDASLDAAVFSLSLMGSNFIDYLREAHRCLKLDAQIWIAEPSSRLKDSDLFCDLLFRLGFDITSNTEKSKFTFIRAIKTERAINEEAIENLQDKTILN